MIDTPNHAILLEILHQKKRVAKADAADLAVKVTTDFKALLDQKYDFAGGDLWDEVDRIATEVAEEAEKTVADRSEKLGFPREFAPKINTGYRGPSVIRDRKAELITAARIILDARLKTVGRQIEKHTLEAMQKIIQPGMTAAEAQAVIDDAIAFDDLMQPVTYEEAEKRRATTQEQPWHDRERVQSVQRSVLRSLEKSARENDDFDAEALRDDFRKLLD